MGKEIAVKLNNALALRDVLAAHLQELQDRKLFAEWSEYMDQWLHVFELIPEWRNKAVWKRESTLVAQMLRDKGFSEWEILEIDPLSTCLARKAFLYSRLLARKRT
jgi:hypothetical protein